MFWLLAFACTGSPEPGDIRTDNCVSIPVPSHIPTARRIEAPVVFKTETISAVETLRDALVTHALHPDLPWAIGHAVVAMGPDLQLTNGANAIEWMFSTYAQRIDIPGDPSALVFPESQGSTRVEPHPSLILKTLTDAGVPPSRSVTVAGQAHTVADLYRGTLASHWHNGTTGGTSFPTLNDTPWSLMALASWSAPTTTWSTTPRGSDACTESSLSTFAQQVARGLMASTDFIAQARARGTQFKKQRQGIFKYTCGGAHLIQGVIHSALRGLQSPSEATVVADQLALLNYRFPIELQQIDDAFQANPQYRIPLAVQRLKLTGHTLETVARVAVAGTTIDIAQPEIESLVEEVTASVDLLRGLKVYQNLHIAKTENEQFFLDVVGDSAHALRGLNIVSGERPVYY